MVVLVQFGASIIVDGAHAVGNIPLSIPDLGVDAYVTNCHKWLCTPRGTALVWVSKKMQPAVLPLVASHGAGLGFQAEHLWAGTADMSAWLAVRTAVAAFERLGAKTLRAKQLATLEGGVADLLKACMCALFPPCAVFSGTKGCS